MGTHSLNRYGFTLEDINRAILEDLSDALKDNEEPDGEADSSST